jgi:hypothetical protein
MVRLVPKQNKKCKPTKRSLVQPLAQKNIPVTQAFQTQSNHTRLFLSGWTNNSIGKVANQN